MNRAAGAVLDLLFPQARCLNCDEPRELDAGSALCDGCRAALEGLRVPGNACPRCLSPKKAGEPCRYCLGGGLPSVRAAYAPFLYRGAARRLVVHLKFGPFELAARPLAAAMARCVSGLAFDALVPVPLHRRGLRARGANQSALLAGRVSGETGIPVREALVKRRETRRQSSLSARARETNVRLAFEAKDNVRGLHLLLVDDVRTTGATAQDCARALLAAGAEAVSLLTAAVAWPGGEDG